MSVFFSGRKAGHLWLACFLPCIVLAAMLGTTMKALADNGGIPFAISIDGEVFDHSVAPAGRNDNGLAAVDIQVKFDGLEVRPALNISTKPIRHTYRAGEEVRFLTSANYPAFIERAEIRLFEQGHEGRDAPLSTIPVAINGEAGWTMPEGRIGEFSYVLRVYDSRGRFDETVPLTLARTQMNLPDRTAAGASAEAIAPGVGDDRTALRNIQVNGGAVTIYGRNVPQGYRVQGFGEQVPVDRERQFVVQRILPSGDHNVAVAVQDAGKGEALRFSRDINIPANDWFYVALADLTIGKRTGSARIEEVRPGEYDKVYTKGRLAFYLKGKIKGEYLLTASADTTEDDIDRIFRDFDQKDPRHLLRRLDPEDYYPVYGDDSIFVEDAPTKGRFYVRLEKGDSHVMWGTYNTAITGTQFMRSQRELYGANAVYRSPETTSFGERRTEATAYISQPDSLPQREEFLATGGSAYFMRRQDIIAGSETIMVEIRDAVTGRIIERRTLRYGEDYSFNYMQGVVILRQPLSSTTGTDSPVRDGALGGNNVYLLANYEFIPGASDVDGYVYGGRAQHWLNDKVRIGVTGMSETTGPADQRAAGIDLQLRHSEKTYLEAEIAHSKGPGFGMLRSTDGGLTWGGQETAGSRNHGANSWRVKGQLGLEDFSDTNGRLGFYYERKERGFSTLAYDINVDQRIWGAHGDVELSDAVRLKLGYDDFKDAEGQQRRDGSASVSWEYDEYWKISFGIKYTDLVSPRAIRSGKTGYDGSRVDGGVRVDYRLDDDRLIYAFAQGTLDRSGDISRNDRGGVGAEIRLTDKIGAKGEISYGTHGMGGLAALTYDRTADDHYYLGYRLDPGRAYDQDRYEELSGRDMGAIVGGIRRRMNDMASAYSESSYDMFGRRRSLTQTYGVVYTPDSQWTINGGLEVGRVQDRTLDINGREPEDFDRYAPSLSLGYKDEEAGINARLRGEVRIERSQYHTRDQNSYLFAAGLGIKTSEDWRLLASVDAALSHATSHETSLRDTDFIEASLGYAYRPVDNNRLNALFRYTYLYDMPGNRWRVDNLGGSYTNGYSNWAYDNYSPAQHSHIISADFNYNLLPWLTMGAKYGTRIGKVRYRLPDEDGRGHLGEWQSSSAHLGIIRADMHIVRKWDLLLEGRVMHMPQADTTDFGALMAVYRHVGDNLKVGVGYNFGRFSDDLRDLTFNDRGVFLNVVGKF